MGGYEARTGGSLSIRSHVKQSFERLVTYSRSYLSVFGSKDCGIAMGSYQERIRDSR